MKKIAGRPAEELAPFHELPGFTEGMHAFQAASLPATGLEARVLTRLAAERGRRGPAFAGSARVWSLALAATLLACGFFGETALRHQAAAARLQQEAHVPAASRQNVSRKVETSAIRTADAQRVPVVPVAVGRRFGRASRLTRELRSKSLPASRP